MSGPSMLHSTFRYMISSGSLSASFVNSVIGFPFPFRNPMLSRYSDFVGALHNLGDNPCFLVCRFRFSRNGVRHAGHKIGHQMRSKLTTKDVREAVEGLDRLPLGIVCRHHFHHWDRVAVLTNANGSHHGFVGCSRP